jgi:hypothetical protein
VSGVEALIARVGDFLECSPYRSSCSQPAMHWHTLLTDCHRALAEHFAESAKKSAQGLDAATIERCAQEAESYPTAATKPIGQSIAKRIRALNTTPAAAQGDADYVLVPREPTEAMVNAAVVPLNRTGSVRAVWSAMLAARPAAAGQTVGDASSASHEKGNR